MKTISKRHKSALAILIPMHNEEVGAEKCLKTVLKEMDKAEVPWHIFITDDGSSDRTHEIVSMISKSNPKKITLLEHKKNKGYGAALASASSSARKQGYTHGICIDSDLTNDPKYIHDFIPYMEQNYDCVKASRFVAGGGMKGVPWFRTANTWLGNFIARRCFNMGILDCTNGFRMLKLESIKDLKYKEKGFASILEELLFLKRRKARCTEIPNVLTSRINTETHFRYNWRTYWNYGKYALMAITA